MKENLLEALPGIMPGIRVQKYTNGKWQEVAFNVPKEMSLTLYINSKELVTILCTPSKLNYLVLGYLYGEGIIDNIDDINLMRVCEEDEVADVKLKQEDFVLPEKRILTSGCGGGLSLNGDDTPIKIDSELSTTPEHLLYLMQHMLNNAGHYRVGRGVHTSALCDNEGIIVMGEDIGRHNTIDKIYGECIFNKISTKDKILITTGRISSEMLRKAVKMQISIIASLKSPTERTIMLARELNVTLVGYVRGNNITVYSNAERLRLKE